jgi:hypothetical protein
VAANHGYRAAAVIASLVVLAGTPAVAAGPRALPPSFVKLELRAFPRPAAQACRDNGHIVRVRPPEGIADAVASARPGTTVLVGSGTYTENRGEAVAVDWRRRNVCVRAARPGRVVLRAAPGQGYGITLAASDAVLEGVTLRGFSSSISLSAGRGRTQRDVTIERVRIERPRGAARDGIAAYDDNRRRAGSPPTVDGLLLRRVSVNGTDIGISCNFGPCEHWWLEDVHVNARRGSEDSGADAFAVEEGRQIAVVDSAFRGASADGIDTKARDVVVFGARVVGVGRNGVKLWHGGDVIDTVLDGTGGDSALVGDAGGRYRYLHVLVTHHAPNGTGYVGAWGYDHPGDRFRIEIVNSIFDSNASGGMFAPRRRRLSVRRTIFGDPRAKLFDLAGAATYMTADLRAFERAGFGSGNIAAAPRLRGRRGRWEPLVHSPARDRALSVPHLDRDLLGRPRTIGPGPDIGPVEARP